MKFTTSSTYLVLRHNTVLLTEPTCCIVLHLYSVSELSISVFTQVIDTAQLLDTLSKECPKLRYLSLLGNIACPNELLGSGHDDEDYQRYR